MDAPNRQTKQDFDEADVLALVEAMWRVVLSSSADLEVQVRSAQLLSDLMSLNKHRLSGLTVQWRPIYKLVSQLLANPPTRTIEGSGMGVSRILFASRLAETSRRFFPQEACGEIWDMLRPVLQPHSGCSNADRYEALGWLVTMTPTHGINILDPAFVNSMVCEWVECWRSLPVGTEWSNLWLALFARLAKHDTTGLICWGPHLPHLFTQILAVYVVPVGSSSGANPVTRSVTSRKVLFLAHTPMSSEADSSAKLMLHLLKTVPPQASNSAQDAGIVSSSSSSSSHCEDALSRFEQLEELLESYAHPSNTGTWCRAITSLIKVMVRTLMKQLATQHDAPSTPVIVPGAGGPLHAQHQRRVAVLSDATMTRIVHAIVRLAGRAQFSKMTHMSDAACTALGQLAYLEPQLVMPLVVQRFRCALDTATAMHQLASSVTTLALCVRPMLLTRWDEGGEEGTTAAMIAEAMMSVLPGIDANDEAKTAAVFRFYSAVLASLPCLPTPGDPDFETTPATATSGMVTPAYRLPLYVEEWAEEVVSRVLALLQNLDSGLSHRGSDEAAQGEAASGSGFMDHDPMALTQMINFLFRKLPMPVSQRLVRMIGTFVAGSSLEGTEWGELCGIAACACKFHPAVMMEALVQPLMKRLEEELPVEGPALYADLSAAHDSALKCHLEMLRSVSCAYEPEMLLPLLPRLQALAARSLGTGSRAVHQEGALLLGCTAGVLVRNFVPTSIAGSPPCAPLLPCGAEAWVDKQGRGGAPLQWGYASPAHIAAAEGLLSSQLLDAVAQITVLCSTTTATASAEPAAAVAAPGAGSGAAATAAAHKKGSHAVKLRLHAEIARVRGMLTGLQSMLPDYESLTIQPGSGGGGVPVSIVGTLGPKIGQPGVRETISQGMALACRHLSGGQDPESLLLLLDCIHDLMCNGCWEYTAAHVEKSSTRALTRALTEPEVAGRYLPPGTPWGKRTPWGLAASRVFHHYSWRVSQAAFRSFATLTLPPSSGSFRLIPDPHRSHPHPQRQHHTVPAGCSHAGLNKMVSPVLAGRCRTASRRVGPRGVRQPSGTAVRSAPSDVSKDAPELASVEVLPPVFLDLLREVVACSMHPVDTVQRTACTVVEACLTRFPILAAVCLPPFLAGLANLPPLPSSQETPSTSTTSATATERGTARTSSISTTYAQLEDAAVNAVVVAAPIGTAGAAAAQPAARSAAVAAAIAAAVAAAGGPAAAAAAQQQQRQQRALLPCLQLPFLTLHPMTAVAAAGAPPTTNGSESERLGKVLGATRAISKLLPFWRRMSRDPATMAALFHALLASRVHNQSIPQAAISKLLAWLASRFSSPPALTHASPEHGHLSETLLALAKPGAMRGATWRSTVVANVLLGMLLPPAGQGAAAAAAAAHLVTLMESDLPAMRRLALAGLCRHLSAIHECGAVNQQLTAIVGDYISSEGVGHRLASSLALDHTHLDAQDSKLGGGTPAGSGGVMSMLQKMMGGSVEEAVITMTEGTEGRLYQWQTWPSVDSVAVRAGLFLITHAQLIHMVSLTAPHAALAAFRPVLTQLLALDKMQVHNTHDKAQQAACAEIMAGLLSSGAAFVEPTDGGSSGSSWLLPLLEGALRTSTLEMADCWAVAVRFAVKGLLDEAVPSRSSPHPSLKPAASPTPAANSQLLPHSALLAGLQSLLDIVLQPLNTPTTLATPVTISPTCTPAASAMSEEASPADNTAAAAAAGVGGVEGTVVSVAVLASGCCASKVRVAPHSGNGFEEGVC
ncbi:MAG: hypothetical protein WDW38_010482 [Sanguina aurantia]